MAPRTAGDGQVDGARERADLTDATLQPMDLPTVKPSGRVMRLPNADQVIIPQRKITEYLLSFTHRDGRSKATFFAAFGFSIATWETFAGAVHQHATSNEVADIEETPFGTSYTVEGPLATPDGQSPRVRVVWFIPTNETIPRLVTAYPLKGARS